MDRKLFFRAESGAAPAPTSTKPSKKYLRKKQVRERYGGISNDTVRRLVNQGRLPPPVFPTGTNRPFWDEEELDAADRRNTINVTAAG
jgi:predicted DNA-binding transcriptional regulator AlpA